MKNALKEIFFFKKKYFLIEGLVILMIFMVMFLSGLINGLERIVSSAIETMDAAYFLVDEDAEGNIPYSMLTDEQVADVEKAKLGDLAELNILRSTFTAKGIKDKQTAAILVTGMVQLLMRAPSKTLEVAAENVDVIAADARSYSERPMKYGVNVYQGAFTVYNYNPEEGSHIQITAKNISVGRKLAPVFGSGIFLSGFNDESGLVEIAELTTGDVYSNGMIPTGQPNLITGGIFIVYGAYVKSIVSNGLVETYGTNDMVLDVWGKVDKWVTKEKVVSYGPSGIGFVNFGSVGFFQAEKAVETYGLGARGFNQYDGTITEAIFHDIVTEGDGSIGMQFSMPVGKIVLENGVTTKGSVGQTLVKGEIKTLHADAISVLKGGEIKELVVQGNLVTEGNDVVGYHVNGGQVHKLSLDGELITKGQESKAIVIENDGQTPTQALQQYL